MFAAVCGVVKLRRVDHRRLAESLNEDEVKGGGGVKRNKSESDREQEMRWPRDIERRNGDTSKIQRIRIT